MMIESLRREGNDTTTKLLVARCANIELIIAATITDQSLRLKG